MGDKPPKDFMMRDVVTKNDGYVWVTYVLGVARTNATSKSEGEQNDRAWKAKAKDAPQPQ